MSKSINFKSTGAYKKYLAYGHMHGVFEATPGNQAVKIANKTHKVVHAKAGTMKHSHPTYKK